MSVADLINDAISTENLSRFRAIIDKYRHNINEYVITDNESDTRLNILHIMSGYQCERKLKNGNSESNIFYKFLDSMSTMDSKFDVNYPARVVHCYNMTAAHLAVRWKNTSMLQALIGYGCDLLICDCNGQNVQDYAIESDDEVISELVQNGIYRSLEKCYMKTFSPLLDANILDEYPESSTSMVSSLSKETTATSFSENNPISSIFDVSLNLPKSSSTMNTTIDSNFDQNKPYEINNRKPISENSINNDSIKTTIYQDDHLELIEQRYEPVFVPVSFCEKNLNESHSCSNGEKDLNDSNDSNESAQSVDELILKMNDKQLFKKLDEIGLDPGPINDGTRKYYQRKFHLLLKEEGNGNAGNDDKMFSKKDCKKGNEEFNQEEELLISKMANYNVEFDSIRSRTFPFKEANRYENLLMKMFQKQQQEEQKKQTHFVYLLLDPAITKNLPSRINFLFNNLTNVDDANLGNEQSSLAEIFGDILNDHTLFYRFIASIFYVGKGQANRPYQHFSEAMKEKNLENTKPTSAKTDRILRIWDQGLGPISLHFFFGITADEAHTREALIIETLSLFNLTNQILGTYRIKLPFDRRQKNILGTYLLYKFFIIHLLNGERQIKMDKLKLSST